MLCKIHGEVEAVDMAHENTMCSECLLDAARRFTRTKPLVAALRENPAITIKLTVRATVAPDAGGPDLPALVMDTQIAAELLESMRDPEELLNAVYAEWQKSFAADSVRTSIGPHLAVKMQELKKALSTLATARNTFGHP